MTVKTISLSVEEAELAHEAARLAAELMCEDAEAHERYSETEFAIEERRRQERFEQLSLRLQLLIESSDLDPRRGNTSDLVF